MTLTGKSNLGTAAPSRKGTCMANDWQGDERRDHPRVSIDGNLQGEIEAAVEAPLMDLSLSGALIEVPSALPANARYALKVPMSESESESVVLHAEVVRSYVHGFDTVTAGKAAVKYRAALKFVDVTEDQQQALKQLIDRGQDDPIRAELSS